jgi:hemerythrin
MPLVTWTDALSVGIASIDTQHKKLVGMLNELYEAVVALRGQNELTAILSGMIAYSQEHFTYEEQEMVRCEYPETKLHQAAHHAFIEFAERTEKKMRNGEFVSSVELLAYLRDWLTNHIKTVDKKYGACLGAYVPEQATGSAS